MLSIARGIFNNEGKLGTARLIGFRDEPLGKRDDLFASIKCLMEVMDGQGFGNTIGRVLAHQDWALVLTGEIASTIP